jgi:hypothetical protein
MPVENGYVLKKKEILKKFFVDGEMAPVFWLRKGKTIWNGKFIEIIRYY